ncbi:L-cysteine:1D-myo-inositol 2-amino-2-deoxy-alpha-D-glucopyranoside ligase, partial [Pseudomonas sp. 2588-5]
LVLVSQLRARGTDPQVIRVLILSNHWRVDWSYTETALKAAGDRLASWQSALQDTAEQPGHSASPGDLQYALMSALAGDLNSPAALDTLDLWAA